MTTHRWRFIGIVISAVCLMIGTCLAVTGVRKTTLDISAPLPTAQWTIPASVLPVPQPSPSGQALVMGGKNRLFIPELSVSAPVVTATVDVAGSLSVPADPAAVGIADSGAALSDNAGSTVLAGHVNMDHQRGALWDLATVTPGASIITFDASGERTSWAVTSLTSSSKSSLPPGLASRSGDRRLVVITCGGQVHNGQYDQNVIAVAVPEPQVTS